MEAKGHASTQYDPGRRQLLVRRSIADPEDLAYYACFGTGDVSLAELARVAGTVDHRRRLQGGQAGGGVYQVRLFGWYRLAMLAHAFLAVTRSYDGKRGICSRENSSH